MKYNQKGKTRTIIRKSALAVAIMSILSQPIDVVEGKELSSTTLHYNDSFLLENNGIAVIEKSPYEIYHDIVSKADNIDLQKAQEVMTRLRELKRLYDEAVRKQQEELKKKQQQQMQMPSRGSSNKKNIFEITAYTPYCGGCSGITASGLNVSNTTEYNGMKIIATDNRIVPMYSIVKIRDGNTEFYAISLDRGGAIKGYKIDLLVRNNKEAFAFGRRRLEVEIIRYGK